MSSLKWHNPGLFQALLGAGYQTLKKGVFFGVIFKEFLGPFGCFSRVWCVCSNVLGVFSKVWGVFFKVTRLYPKIQEKEPSNILIKIKLFIPRKAQDFCGVCILGYVTTTNGSKKINLKLVFSISGRWQKSLKANSSFFG